MEGLHSEFRHPFGFILVFRYLPDNLLIQPLSGIDDRNVTVMETVLIVILGKHSLIFQIGITHSDASLSSIICCIAFQPIVAHLILFACLYTF